MQWSEQASAVACLRSGKRAFSSARSSCNDGDSDARLRPCKDRRGLDLISDTLLFGRLWYAGSDATGNAIGYAKHRSRSHDAVIRVYDDAGDVIQTHEHKGDFKRVVNETNQALFELARLVGAGIVGGLIASFANHRFTLSGECNGSVR